MLNHATPVSKETWKEIPEIFFRGIGLNKQVNSIGGISKVERLTEQQMKDMFQPRQLAKLNRSGSLVAYIDFEIDTYDVCQFNLLLNGISVNGVGLSRISNTQLSYGFLIEDQEGYLVNIRNMKNNNCQSAFQVRTSLNQFMLNNDKLVTDSNLKDGACYDITVDNPGKFKDGSQYGKGIIRLFFVFDEGSPVKEGYDLTFRGHITYLSDVSDGFNVSSRTLSSGNTESRSGFNSGFNYSNFRGMW